MGVDGACRGNFARRQHTRILGQQRLIAAGPIGYLFVEENVVGIRTPIPKAKAPVRKFLVVGAGGDPAQAGGFVVELAVLL